MFTADNWKDYEVIDTSNGDKLERWGQYILRRPDPQIIWSSGMKNPLWKRLNGHYHRSAKGGGEWEFFHLPKQWTISYVLGGTEDCLRKSAGTQETSDSPKNRSSKEERSTLNAEYFRHPQTVDQLAALRPEDRKLTFHLKPFAFKHTGLFPEQAANWDWFSELILKEIKRRASEKNVDRVRVLNLFAYTGGATLAAAKAGAAVTHVDASKGMVQWAKENAESSGLKDAPIRWLVDDCMKFVEREIRRGSTYDAIIMDPPSYGRGPKGEIWKIEDQIYSLIQLASKLLSREALFFLLNSYTTGLQPAVMTYMLSTAIVPEHGGTAASDEVGLPVTETGLYLPCGCSGRWISSRAES